ncbi:ABC transporter substrate-binding protein [Geomonas sp. RF6]|uniref:ABC transporter substrate-binding protein n=1 Tax=Geomonas sp. RF6 TaxID=2897342 RepID=UPI001E47C2B9|nr:ABC transporter substrate-binding protein [Geomonas sp. RF6]UFS68772.1 ABC transporter substrate-binding protein [Geomonas sp. RF6]
MRRFSSCAGKRSGRLKRVIFPRGIHAVATLLCGLITLLSSTVESAAPQYGGTLTIAVDREFRGFDPLNAGYLQLGDRSVVMAVEERLFSTDTEGNLVPELALSATVSKDELTWSIKLRTGVYFHDGTPFNADAVVQHWQRMLDPAKRYPGALYLEPVDSVTKGDDYTVLFTLKHPWAPLRAMLSESQWMGAFIPSPKAVRAKTQSRAPVGTGPFVFKEWVPNDRLVVLQNRNYWRKGRPYLDKVIFRPIADASARLAALTEGRSDIVLSDVGSEVATAKGDTTLKVYSAQSTGPYTLIINTKVSPLDDSRVRRALAYAWDQETYVKSMSGGPAPVARDPFGGTLSCADVSYRNHDLPKARELLTAYGSPVALELLESDTPRGRAAGKLVQQLFNGIGVTVTVTHLPEGELVQRVMRGNYQLSGWRLMDLDDMGPYFNVTLQSEGKLNFSRYSNAAMDELLKIQQTTDGSIRQNALCRIASLINEDVMYLYAGTRRFHLISRGSIRGISGAEHGVVRVSEAWLQSGKGQPRR